jgi:hypothetical protein
VKKRLQAEDQWGKVTVGSTLGVLFVTDEAPDGRRMLGEVQEMGRHDVESIGQSRNETVATDG